VGAIPVALMIYLFVFARATISPRAGFALVEYMTVLAMLILHSRPSGSIGTRDWPSD
jgi:hypothetical protein